MLEKNQLESFGCPKCDVPLASQVRVATSLIATQYEPTQKVPVGLAQCPRTYLSGCECQCACGSSEVPRGDGS